METSQLLELLDPSGRVDAVHETRNTVVQDRDIDGMFHPSSVGGCRRRLSYALVREMPKHRIPTKLRRTFQHGHSIHVMLQSWMHTAFNADIGEYTCSFRDEVSINRTFLAKKHNIAGSADGLIELIRGDEVIRIVYEAKSASHSSWSGVGSPMPKHITQANMYATCLEASHILFDYYNKDKDVHKYFLVEQNEAKWLETVDELTAVVDRLNEGELMDREANSFECRTCQYYHVCTPELY